MIQNITMLGIWTDALAWITATTGITNGAVIFTLAFAVAVTAPVAALAIASWFAARRNLETTLMNFTRFGYALIPLDVAAHLAHNMFHLLAEGGSVITTVADLFGITTTGVSTALVGTGTIRALQFVLLAAGVASSLYTARRITNRRYRTPARRQETLAPYVVVIVVLAAANSYLFWLPMAHRM
jgi:hypothetical protein